MTINKITKILFIVLILFLGVVLFRDQIARLGVVQRSVSTVEFIAEQAYSSGSRPLQLI